MSELRPSSPLRRPDTARPRGDAGPPLEAPSAEELAAIERHLAMLPVEAGAEASDDPSLGVLRVRLAGAGPEAHYAALPRWTAGETTDRLEAVTLAMLADRAWPSLLLAPDLDRPADLEDRLRASGWLPVHGETALWTARAAVVPHLDPGLRIEAVTGRGVETHEALERAIFGHPERTAPARREALGRALEGGRLRAYLVHLRGEPVAVARLSQGPGVAGLSGIGVVEGHRGRGLGTLITTVATRAGLATGNRLVWLSVEDGNEAARRTYAALGFARGFRWSRWMAPRARRDDRASRSDQAAGC